jgi:hypothetical protein
MGVIPNRIFMIPFGCNPIPLGTTKIRCGTEPVPNSIAVILQSSMAILFGITLIPAASVTITM